MIPIKVTNMKVCDDVFMNKIANYTIYIHRSCRSYCHNCLFLENEGEVDLKKMYFVSKICGTLIYDMSLPNNYAIHTNPNKC